MDRSFEIKIRPAISSDATGIMDVRVDTWRDSYVGLLPDSYLIKMPKVHDIGHWRWIIDRMSDPWQFAVADYKGKIVGYCYGGRQRRSSETITLDRAVLAEIYELYVHPNFQRHGVGTSLLLELVKRLGQFGYTALILSMLAGNRSGKRFYENLGGEMEAEFFSTFMGISTRECLYRWGDLDSLIKNLESIAG